MFLNHNYNNEENMELVGGSNKENMEPVRRSNGLFTYEPHQLDVPSLLSPSILNNRPRVTSSRRQRNNNDNKDPNAFNVEIDPDNYLKITTPLKLT